MRKRKNSPIYVSESDFYRLEKLIQRHHDLPSAKALDEELSRADIVPDKALPKNTVTLNARVAFVDIESGAETEVTLVMPDDADVAQSRVSVLSPVGSALLGLKKNGYIEWPLPKGGTKKLAIVSVQREETAPERATLANSGG